MSPAESSNSPAPGPVVSLRHGTYEDAQALFSGTLFVAMALMLFNQAGLLIGSTAGMAFLLHYVTDISFGKLFFVVNLPFYWFAWTRMGREFTLKTFICVALLSLLTELFPQWRPASLPVHLVYPWARYYPTRLRKFLDLMREIMPDLAGMQPPQSA